MGQKQAEVELTHLEHVINGFNRRWRFKAQPNPHFDQLIHDFMAVHLFQIREVYFTLGSGDYAKKHAYEISEEGMWFLSHLFTNWTEMREKAESSNQWQAHQERTHQAFNFHFEYTDGTFHGRAEQIDMEEVLRRFRFQQAHFTHTFTQTSTIPNEVRDAHKLLGIAKDRPTEDEIKQAFRTKVKTVHPDTGGKGGDLDNLTRAKERALKFAGVE